MSNDHGVIYQLNFEPEVEAQWSLLESLTYNDHYLNHLHTMIITWITYIQWSLLESLTYNAIEMLLPRVIHSRLQFRHKYLSAFVCKIHLRSMGLWSFCITLCFIAKFSAMITWLTYLEGQYLFVHLYLSGLHNSVMTLQAFCHLILLALLISHRFSS